MKYLCTKDGGYWNEPCEIISHVEHKGIHYQVVWVNNDHMLVVTNDEVKDEEQA